MNKIEIFYSKSKLIKAFLLALLMSFAAGLLAAKLISSWLDEKSSVLSTFSFNDIFSLLFLIISAFALTVSLAAAFVFAARMFDSRPQVIISREGIDDRRLNLGIIEWNKTAFALLNKDKYTEWISLNLREPEKYYHRLPKFELFLRRINGQKNNNNFHVRFNDLDKSAEEVWEFIENSIIKSGEEKGLHLMP